jgi:hypothetical protein
LNLRKESIMPPLAASTTLDSKNVSYTDEVCIQNFVDDETQNSHL